VTGALHRFALYSLRALREAAARISVSLSTVGGPSPLVRLELQATTRTSAPGRRAWLDRRVDCFEEAAAVAFVYEAVLQTEATSESDLSIRLDLALPAAY
jgi:hypothetical protein